VRVEWDKFYYTALPDCLTIKESKIAGAGLGLFATNDIERKYDFGTSHIKVPPIVGYIRTPIGGFVNHSKKSNTIIIQLSDWDDYKIFNLLSICKIKKGEELLLNYEDGDSKFMTYSNAD
jgi:hypothetical protein|tara:strand:+ start:82 stop:441 length:360 start_codon:yes stop_codon:yes gene_type:complete